VLEFDKLSLQRKCTLTCYKKILYGQSTFWTYTKSTQSTLVSTRPVKRNSSESFQCVVRKPSQHGRNAYTAPSSRRRWETAAVWFLALIEGHERVSNRITVDVTRGHRPVRRHKAKTEVEKSRVSNERTIPIARTHMHLRH